MKKILIIYATAGEGHKRAAFAIKDAFDRLHPQDAQIKIIDVLDYTNAFFKRSYLAVYIFMVTYIPRIWGLFYYVLDWKWMYPFVKVARRLVNGINAKPFEEFLSNFNPDVVVSTHFLVGEVISNLKRKGILKTKLITCITDFRMHSFWVSKETDFFCVGFSETRMDLVKKWGIPTERIQILGIPTNPKFYELKKKEVLCGNLRISEDLFTILITGGGFGVGPIMALVKTLLKINKPLQVLTVCGHNKNLKDKIDKLVSGNRQSKVVVRNYGFVDYVDELMTVSDMAVTKAGGLICSEALAKELPLIIIAPIPGQEGRNCRLLLINNAAFKLNNPRRIKEIVQNIYRNRDMLKTMKKNIQRIKRQDAGINIAKFSLKV